MTRYPDALFRRSSRLTAWALAVLCLSATACDMEGEFAVEEETSFRAAATTQRFADRVGDMARAAEFAYYNGDQAHQELTIRRPGGGTAVHRHRANLSSDNTQVYEWSDGVHGPRFSVVVAFRGTVPTSLNDLRHDLDGMTRYTTDPLNPWVHDTTVVGKVGQGFQQRVVDYMESEGGQALRNRLDQIMNINGTTLDIHVVGHSLGGIASQLFSVQAARYMESRGYEREERYKVFNFAFNAPKGVDEAYAHQFAQDVLSKRFLGFNLTRGNDPVSEWTFTIPWVSPESGLADPRDPHDERPDAGYCPGAQLPAAVPCANINNHALDDATVSAWGELGDGGWDEGVAECMSRDYAPLVLGPG
ncbi:MAG: hypothetical protein AAF799_30135 [Myxococcota bacterium]